MNKFYEMFINNNIDDSLINVNPNSLTFEDRFWHFACLSVYYKNKNNKYMQKKCLSAACDLNYYHNAFIFYDAYEVLPKEFKKDYKKFEHSMNNEKIDAMIKEVNKIDKKFNFKGFILYSLITLSIIPIMLLLVLVFHLDSTLSAIISIVFLFLGQSFISPMNKQRKLAKERKQEEYLTKNEKSYFNYVNHLSFAFSDPRYMAMIKAANEEEVKKIAELIKTNQPLPEKKKKNK